MNCDSILTLLGIYLVKKIKLSISALQYAILISMTQKYVLATSDVTYYSKQWYQIQRICYYD